MTDLPYEVEVKFTCSFCWEQFQSPVALLEHEAMEDDRLYDVDGLTWDSDALEVRPDEVR